MKKRICSLLLAACMVISLLPIHAEAVQSTLNITGNQDYDEVHAVVEEVNRQREKAGLPALTLDAGLTEYAMARAAETAIYNDHNRPDGTKCETIFKEEDSKYLGHCGENIAVGFLDAAEVMDGWMNSPGHKGNILDDDYQSIGVGCFYQPNGIKCWVQLFSRADGSGSVGSGVKSATTGVPFSTAYVSFQCASRIVVTGKSTPVKIQVQNKEYPDLISTVELPSASYSMADPSIAAVNKNGEITGLKKGTTTLTVSASGVTLTGTVTVSDVEALYADNDPDTGYPRLHWVALPEKPEEYYVWRIVEGKANNVLIIGPVAKAGKTSYEYVDSHEMTPGETYCYTLCSKDGTQFLDDLVSVRCGYGRPMVKTKTDSSGKHYLTWTEVSGAAQYEVQRADSQNGTYSKLKTTSATAYTDTTAETGKTYYYRVRCVAADGTTGAYSDVVSVTYTVLTAPTLSVTLISGKPVISWEPVDGAQRYEMRYSTNSDGSNASAFTLTDTTYPHENAKAGTTYYYWVRALSADGSGPYAGVQVVAACANPSGNISLNENGQPVIQLKKADGAKGFEIQRSTSRNSGYKTVQTIETTSGTTWTDESAKANTTYYYRIKTLCAANSAGDSGYTTASITTPLGKPVVSITTSSGKPKLKWDAVDGAAQYAIYRAASEKGSYELLYVTDKTTYTDKNTDPASTYYYKVRSIGSDNLAGPYSAAKHITCKCAAPTDVTISVNSSSGKPKLTWKAVSGASKYEVYRATSKSGTYKKLTTTTKTSCTNTSAEAGKTYYYKVKAVCASGSSGNSGYSSVVSALCKCAKPVVKITTSSGKPKLTWNAVDGASKYMVYRATSKSGTYEKLTTTTKTSCTNTSAKKGKTYYYKVKAVNSKTSSANSAYSAVKSIKATK